MNAVHPTFAPFLASIAPPTFCRRCAAKITPTLHTLVQCDANQNEQARIAFEYRRAAGVIKTSAWHEANDRAALKAQIQNNPEHWGIE